MTNELEAPDYVRSVLPSEILRQRENGWPDFHPETFCHRCGHRNANWWADGDDWETATASLPRGVMEILCPSCFAELYAEATGEFVAWSVRRDR